MIGRLTVHIGPPKTGTTAIQEALRASRDELALDGVLFGTPSSSRADHFLAGQLWATAAEASGIGAPTVDSGWYLATPSFEHLMREYSKGCPRRVISCEDLAAMPSGTVAGFLDTVQPADVEVIVGVRSPAKWLFSLWQQYCKIPNVEPWESFVARAHSERLLFVSRSVESWIVDARVSKLHILPLEVTDDPGLVSRFADAADVRLTERSIHGGSSTRPNASLGAIEALLVAGTATRVAQLSPVFVRRFGRLGQGEVSRHLMDIADLARPYFELAQTQSVNELFYETPFDRSAEKSVRAYCSGWAADALEFGRSSARLTDVSREALVGLAVEAQALSSQRVLWAPHPAGYPRADFPDLIRQSAVTVASDRLLAAAIGLIHLRSQNPSREC